MYEVCPEVIQPFSMKEKVTYLGYWYFSPLHFTSLGTSCSYPRNLSTFQIILVLFLRLPAANHNVFFNLVHSLKPSPFQHQFLALEKNQNLQWITSGLLEWRADTSWWCDVSFFLISLLLEWLLLLLSVELPLRWQHSFQLSKQPTETFWDYHQISHYIHFNLIHCLKSLPFQQPFLPLERTGQ